MAESLVRNRHTVNELYGLKASTRPRLQTFR